jgi:CRISPR-associated exonuclease Cas4
VILILVLIILAIILLILSSRVKKQAGIPGGKIVYSDTHMWGAPLEKPLFDGSLGITGKPDYLVQQGNEIIPVEVKSSQAPDAPYDSHIFQVAIYCLLVEKVYQQTPSYGLIHYPGKTFQVDFTPELKEAALELVSEMHHLERNKNIHRSHEEQPKCSRCGYKDICEERL